VYRQETQGPRAFAQDPLALALAQELVASGQDRNLPLAQRSFAYMPYMHSESALIHEQAVALFSQPGLEDNLRFEHAHKAIIDRFGRYPPSCKYSVNPYPAQKSLDTFNVFHYRCTRACNFNTSRHRGLCHR
jgi:uncharacterized protein (DUF924 family)